MSKSTSSGVVEEEAATETEQCLHLAIVASRDPLCPRRAQGASGTTASSDAALSSSCLFTRPHHASARLIPFTSLITKPSCLCRRHARPRHDVLLEARIELSPRRLPAALRVSRPPHRAHREEGSDG
jgi:hypothetical protein